MNDLFPFELERELVVITSPKVKPDALTSPEMAGFILVTRVQEVAPARLDAPEVTRAYWEANIATLPYFDPDREFFFAFIVDTKFNVKGVSMVSCGTLNESLAHPREVFRAAVAMAGYAVILAHNHPSGDPTPSAADREMTRKMVSAGELLGIRVLDSIVIGDGRHFSFRESGQI